MSLWQIILVLVVLALIFGGLPTWGYSRSWGYGPSGIGGLILIVVLCWLFFGGGIR